MSLLPVDTYVRLDHRYFGSPSNCLSAMKKSDKLELSSTNGNDSTDSTDSDIEDSDSADTGNETIDFSKIDVRPRENEQAWNLDFDDYAIVSKYITDMKTGANFTKVSTRTNCMFNLFSNMGMNVSDPDDWNKLQTHIIHTDIDDGISDFLPFMKNRILKGNHLSFSRYLDCDIVLYRHASGKYEMLTIGEKIPEELYIFMVEYLDYAQKDANFFITGNFDSDLYGHAVQIFTDSKQYITSNTLREYIQDDRDRRGSIVITKLYPLLQRALSDEEFMRGEAEKHDIPIAFRTESYMNIHGVDIPVYTHTREYKDDAIIGMLLADSTLVSSESVKTFMEEIVRERLSDLYVNSYGETSGVNTTDNIAIIQLESFIDKRDYYKGIGKNKPIDAIAHGKITVVYLPTLIYNYIQIAFSDMIDPISNKYYYIKGTTIVCSYVNVEEEQYNGSNTAVLVEKAKKLDGKLPYTKRFCVSVELYKMHNPASIIPNDFRVAPIKKDPINCLSYKYAYTVAEFDRVSQRFNPVVVSKKFKGYQRQSIRSLVFEPQFLNVVIPFRHKPIMKVDMRPNAMFGFRDEDMTDGNFFLVYVHGVYISLYRYLELKSGCNAIKRKYIDDMIEDFRPLQRFYDIWKRQH